MAILKKAQLAENVAEKLNMSKKQGAEILDAVVEEISSALGRGDKINITGFGVFKVMDRKERMGVNPKTGERIKIAASKRPKFTPGKVLKEMVK